MNKPESHTVAFNTLMLLVGCSYDCSEDSGYAMLGAAYMADKTTFDGLLFRNHDTRLKT